MAEKPWKKTERSIARWLNGKRVPITGRQRGDAPDVAHRTLSIEVKHRKKVPGYKFIRDALAQAIASKKSEDQVPVLITHEAGIRHRHDLVIMYLEDFVRGFLDDEGQIQKLRTVWRGLDSEIDGVWEEGSEDVPGRKLETEPTIREAMATLARETQRRIDEKRSKNNRGDD